MNIKKIYIKNILAHLRQPKPFGKQRYIYIYNTVLQMAWAPPLIAFRNNNIFINMFYAKAER